MRARALSSVTESSIGLTRSRRGTRELLARRNGKRGGRHRARSDHDRRTEQSSGDSALKLSGKTPSRLSHWTGLPRKPRQTALFAVAAILLIDVMLQYLAMRRGGFRPLVGRNDALGYWDLIKAAASGAALILTGRRGRSAILVAFGLVLVFVGIEERLALHAAASQPVADLLQFQDWVPGIHSEGARRLGEFVFLGLIAIAVFGFIWGRRRPNSPTILRARLLLSLLLGALFLFAAVVDLANGVRGLDLEVLEEVGERAIVTLIAGYSAGLLSFREWLLLP